MSSNDIRVVVGVDGSEPSKLALRWGARIATANNATLHAVIAWQYPALYGAATLPIEWNPADDAKATLTETLQEVFDDKPPVEITEAVIEGHPAHVLLDAAKDALMVVVGSRGHGGFVGLLLGSISANVAEHADCPVLVVHTPASEATP